MAVTFAEYQRRCLEMSPGISPREAVRHLKLGVLTADGRLAGGWKVIKSLIIRGFIVVCAELTAIHIHALLFLNDA